MTWSLFLTCEHAGNKVPHELKSCFPREAAAILATHRGWDIGALAVAKSLASEFDAPLHFTEWSRLVVDANRSRGHPRHFSDYTRHLPRAAREQILAAYYDPYRLPTHEAITALVKKGSRVFHLSVHSFTPELNGDVRRAGIGLLYDPRRASEKKAAGHWVEILADEGKFLPVRRNYPYLGIGDGFVSSLRRELPADRYIGFELEMNQKHLLNARDRARMADALARSLTRLLPALKK